MSIDHGEPRQQSYEPEPAALQTAEPEDGNRRTITLRRGIAAGLAATVVGVGAWFIRDNDGVPLPDSVPPAEPGDPNANNDDVIVEEPVAEEPDAAEEPQSAPNAVVGNIEAKSFEEFDRLALTSDRLLYKTWLIEAHDLEPLPEVDPTIGERLNSDQLPPEEYDQIVNGAFDRLVYELTVAIPAIAAANGPGNQSDTVKYAGALFEPNSSNPDKYTLNEDLQSWHYNNGNDTPGPVSTASYTLLSHGLNSDNKLTLYIDHGNTGTETLDGDDSIVMLAEFDLKEFRTYNGSPGGHAWVMNSWEPYDGDRFWE